MTRRAPGDASATEPAPGLRPLQIVCLLGAFTSVMVAFLAFDEPSIKGFVVALAFVAVLVLHAMWRGLTTGELPYRHSLIDGAREPWFFFTVLVFYAFLIGMMIYISVDLLAREL
ncbi:MAG: hypothetical protein R3A79_26660 [Nannocystaceae bacterium]